MKTCPDCGCKLNGGICSNCQEELYILEYQSDCIDFPLSKEFLSEADRQQKSLASTERKG